MSEGAYLEGGDEPTTPELERWRDWTPEQRRIHGAIAAVGGYWEPGAAVLRMVEELGELADALAGVGDVAEELADLVIISTCIANQFQVGLASVTTHTPLRGAGSVAGLDDLVSACGRIARIVNYYAGPKRPRSAERLEHLEQPILELHRDLRALAAGRGVDLRATVAAKTNLVLLRDADRFPNSFDPNEAQVLQDFAGTRVTSPCTFARAAKLWGAPTWQANRNTSYNCEIAVPYLLRFARAANREGLDGFVMKLAPSVPLKTVNEVGALLRDVVRALTRFDPNGGGVAQVVEPEPGWQFTFAGQRMFLTVFSEVYPAGHVRFAENGTFVMFQPEESFSTHGVGSKLAGSERIKDAVRASFARQGQTYPLTMIERRVEAALYLLPVDGDEPVAWWDERRDDPDQPPLF